jgi:hypothetical protein
MEYQCANFVGENAYQSILQHCLSVLIIIIIIIKNKEKEAIRNKNQSFS